jgi:hypothetical protein
MRRQACPQAVRAGSPRVRNFRLAVLALGRGWLRGSIRTERAHHPVPARVATRGRVNRGSGSV